MNSQESSPISFQTSFRFVESIKESGFSGEKEPKFNQSILDRLGVSNLC